MTMSGLTDRTQWPHALLALGILWGLLLGSATAQVVVAPKSLHLSDDDTHTSLLVENQANQAQEVIIDFRFGYPVSDEEGRIHMQYDDADQAGERDIGERLRPYPQQFLLPPGQRQRVRVAVTPPGGDADDGTYWSRMTVTATAHDEATPAAAGDGVQMSFNYRFRQVIPVLYRHGDQETGLEIENGRLSRDGSDLYLLVDLHRTGNAPYVGTAELEIRDQDTGETVDRKERNISAYTDLTQRFPIPEDELGAGQYVAQLAYETRREDISSSDLVLADDVTHIIEFEIE